LFVFFAFILFIFIFFFLSIVHFSFGGDWVLWECFILQTDDTEESGEVDEFVVEVAAEKETRDKHFGNNWSSISYSLFVGLGNSSIRNDKRMDTRGVGGEIQLRDMVGTSGRLTPSQEIIRILSLLFPPRDLWHRP